MVERVGLVLNGVRLLVAAGARAGAAAAAAPGTAAEEAGAEHSRECQGGGACWRLAA